MTIFDRLLKKKTKPIMGSPASNDDVRAQLANFGDDGAAVRHVLHYAYPQGAAAPGLRTEMVERLKSQGYAVKDAVAENGLVLEHYRSVSPEDFDKVTAELSAWFAERGWDYDGWECAVVQKADR